MRSIPFLLCFALGCGPSTTSADREPPPIDISSTALIEAYRFRPEVAESAFTGRRIRVHVEDYRVFEDSVGVDSGMPDSPPLLVFLCLPPAPGPLVIEGRCRGRVEDGRPRAAGVRWYLLVDQCSWVPQ